MKNEDVKIGMRVVYNPGTPNEDRGVVTQIHSEDNWWVVWDSDGGECWIEASSIYPDPRVPEQKEEEMPDRIEMMMKLLNAAKEGKQIEQADAGHWYDSDIAFVNVSNVHRFRVKPKKIKTIGYRRYVITNGKDYSVSIWLAENTEPVERQSYFVEWIDKEWQYYEVEV